MKTFRLSCFFLLSLMSVALAAINGKCHSKAGTGTCKKDSSCNSGFTVTGACPDDGPDIKCCISKSCTKVQKAPLISLGGQCFDKKQNHCSGGHFEKGLCPGPTDVQCCIKSGSSTPPPPPPSKPPSCPPVKGKIPGDITLSRERTKKAASVFKGAERVLDICTIIGALVGEGVGGIPCGVASIGAGKIADHAEECTDKNQCLKLKGVFVPFCVGGSECCSEG